MNEEINYDELTSEQVKKMIIHNIMSELGKRGGAATLKKYGKKHFRKCNEISNASKNKVRNQPIIDEILDQVMKDCS